MPALDLTGPQKRQLRETLVDAFETWDELNAMTQFQLDLNLERIAGSSGGLDAAALKLINWAESRGLLAQLIVGMRNERPKSEKVAALADLTQLTSTGETTTLEKLVTDNQLFLNMEAWRDGQLRAEWCVCRLEFQGQGVGTGFLVGPDLVLTNHHVVATLIDTADERPQWRARFDHKVAANNTDLVAGRAIAFAEDWLVDSSPDRPITNLDFALIRLAEPVGDQPVGTNEAAAARKWIAISAATIDFTAKRMISILQHPSGGPMKLAMGMAEKLDLNAEGTRVRYSVPTLEGSSGSPVFDQDWKLLALHHAGLDGKYNEAIPIALIAARPKVAAALPKS